MKKRPILLATLTITLLFSVFLLLVFVLGPAGSTSDLMSVSDKIGVIDMTGPITSAQELTDDLISFGDNQSIKAVILRIDSPGGAVGPSQEIYQEVLRLQKKKPVIVSMGSVAASGGYYIAAAAGRLFANPGTITGSIGVIMTFPNYEELMQKVGVATVVVKSGRFKDMGSATRSFTEDERKLLQSMIDDVHAQFVEAVSLGRELPAAEVVKIADGRIFSGRQALALGLIDELGGFQDALRYAADLTGLGDDPHLVYPEAKRQGLLERIINMTLGDLLPTMSRAGQTGPQYLWPGVVGL
ncbi:MAG: signal peptide peptidase SppA [Deltaproteobacteria bacterium]|nr:signal peptide peptidase SppA [Deltaproteobacteria bacterium]NCP03359.1 signal peptide peptidase SppA [Deltaproteobacteria bacterium]